MIKYLATGDQQLLEQAEGAVDEALATAAVQRELIMQVLDVMLSTDIARQRVEVVVLHEQATALEGKLYDRISAIVAHTYAEMGDRAHLADDEALLLIKSLLLDFDKDVIERNRRRKFRARQKGWRWR